MNSAGRVVPAGLAMIAVTYGLARFAYGLFLPELREAFDLDASVLGFIGAGSYAGYCVAVVVSLVFTARVGARSMVVAAGTIAVLGMALVAAAPNVSLLAVGVLVAGFSSGLASPPMGEAVARAVVPGKQDRANALINSGTGVGVVLSGPAALLAADDWRLAWAAFVAIGLVVLVWNAKVMPGRQAPPPVEKGLPRLSLRWLLGPRSAPLFVAAAGIGLASAAYWTFSREFVVRAGGLDHTGSTVFWVVIGVSGIAGGAAGDLVSRFGLARALRGSLLAMAAAIWLLGATPASGLVVLASAALFGASYIALSGVILVWSVSVFGERPSAGLGAAFLLLAAGQALGSPFAGMLAGTTSLTTTFWVFACIALATMLVRPRPEDAHAAPEPSDPRFRGA
ncbi:MAG TPA: MFS transporter [Rubrobacteraceae bacterium]|nr:MFS transporter [Rubrobacteraceae bacterium]